MSYNVSSRYKQVIYSGDAQHKLKILFNNVELQDADRYCEKLTIKSRIMPNGAKRIELSSFVSKEAEIIFHDIDTSIIQDQVSISIGTLVDNAYEYVPIGIFNIQDKPTTDKDKTTIKLRDNSVKFDFNYDAKPLIEQHGGSATKLQILQDICSKAGVTWVVSSFIGSSDLVGIYDNTITARQYVAYIAEQAGRIATINRNGELAFININAANTQTIPIDIVEKYEAGKPYRIGKVVYEDAIRKYETESTQFDTLYLDSANPYVSSQEQVNSIYQQLNGFKIDSYKTGKILGNPAIDPFDKIQVHVVTRNLFNKNLFDTFEVGYKYLYIELEPNTTYTMSSNIPISSLLNTPNLYAMPSNKQPNPTKYGIKPNSSVTITTLEDGIVKIAYRDSGNEFEDEKNAFWYQLEKGNYATQYVPYKDETYTTLATNDLVYNGALIQTFDTQIGEEERKENVTITGQATFKKWARTEIDNVNAEILIQTGRIDNVEKEINPTKDANGTSFYLEDSTDADLVNFELEGKTTQETSTQSVNLFDEEYYKNATYATNIYKYTLARIKGTGTTLYTKASLKSGKTNISGLYMCLSSTPNPNSSGSKYSMFVRDGALYNGNFTPDNNIDLYFSFYPTSVNVSDIFDTYNIWVSTTDTSYTPFTPNSPSPDYPSELVSVGYENKFNIEITPSWLGGNTTYELSNNTLKVTGSWFAGILINVEANTDYYVNATRNIITSVSSTGKIAIYNASKTFIKAIGLQDGTFNSGNNTQVYVVFYAGEGSSGSCNFSDIIVTKGTKAHDYIDYGKYGIKIITHGTNYFDASKIANTNIVVSDNGKTIKMPVVASGNGYTATGATLHQLAPNLKVGDTIYVRFMRSPSNDYNKFIYLHGSNTLVYATSTSSPRTITQADLDGSVSLYGNRASSGETTQAILTDFRIIKQQDVEYEPYKSKTLLYTLNEPLRSIGDTKDLLYIKNGYLYVERKIGSVVLDTFTSKSGSTANNQFSTDVISNIVKPQYGTIVSNILSSHFISKAPNTIYANDTTGIGVNTNGTITCGLGLSSGINTLELANQWLSTNKPEVNYILANSYIEELGQVNYPTTYKPITYIETTDELQPNMAITYVMDTQLTNYVEEHVAQIKVNEDSITSRVETIEDSDYGGRISAVETQQTSTDFRINAISKNVTYTEFDDDGNPTNSNINSVTTTTGFTFNAEGMTIADNQTSFKAQHTKDGTYYYDGTAIVGQYTKDGSKQKDLYLYGVYYYGMDDRTDTPMFVAQLYQENGNDVVGHFYNGGN